MLRQLRPAIGIFLAFTVITGVAYPLVVTAIAQGLFAHRANGSLIDDGGETVGSELIGQVFDQPQYFWGRLSATSPFGYNAGASGGSNLGPTNPALIDAAKSRIDALKAADPDNTAPIPVDLVTASGSGLDPHISPAAAEYQVNRVAKARSVDPKAVQKVVEQLTEGRTFGVLGEPCVNVLLLNRALDKEFATP